MSPQLQQRELKRTLGPFHLWAIAVGLVISGEYFGWSYGWASAGTLGFLVTTIAVAAMYIAFIFSFTELTTAIPHAGGPFAYGLRAFGPLGGAVAGFATLVEFLFAPPAISLAIGAYLHVQFPALEPKHAALGAYAVFMALNIVGVHIAASFEVVVTLLAVGELIVFMGVVLPAFRWSNFLAGGWAGQDHFSMEEAKEPRKTIPMAYISGILTLTVLAFGVMLFAGGSGSWAELSSLNDPLPQAMKRAVGASSGWLHMLVWLGLFGLVASFHGIIMGYARQIFALGRAGYLPAVFARLHPRFNTPHIATLAGGVVGIAAIYSDAFVSIAGQSLTASVVTLSAFGALLMYIVSMAALFRLRRIEPELARPFRAPLYPFAPAFALGMASLALVTMVWNNRQLAVIFAGLMVVMVAGALVLRRRDAA